MRIFAYNVLLFSLLISTFGSSKAVDFSNYNIYYQEIQKAKEKDSYLKKRKNDIDHPLTKILLNNVDLIKQMEEKDKKLSLFGRFKKNFFLNRLAEISSQIVLLNENQTPKLFEEIKKISEKLNIPMPLVCLFEDENFLNAAAFSITTDFSMIFIGEKLLKLLTKEQFEAVLAHELSHIEKNHVLKEITIATITSIVTIISGVLLGGAINEKYFNNGFGSGLALRFSFIFSLLLIEFYLMLKLSQKFEKQADITALKSLDDPNSIISLMKTFDEKIDKKLEKEIEFLKERIKSEISENHPKEAEQFEKIAKDTLWWDNFARKWISTHPTSKQRKEYLEKEVEKMNMECQIVAV